jgi:Cft2 family RNA processing exonuclease
MAAREKDSMPRKGGRNVARKAIKGSHRVIKPVAALGSRRELCCTLKDHWGRA